MLPVFTDKRRSGEVCSLGILLGTSSVLYCQAQWAATTSPESGTGMKNLAEPNPVTKAASVAFSAGSSAAASVVMSSSYSVVVTPTIILIRAVTGTSRNSTMTGEGLVFSQLII